MNNSPSSFARLLGYAVVKPRAAVDLALQHMQPRKLAWMLVVALALGTWLCDFIAAKLISAWRGGPLPETVPPQWFESDAFLIASSLLIYAVVYLVTRWYWKRFVKADARAIDAALVASFSFSLVTTPIYSLFSEMTANLKDIWGFLTFSVLPLIEMAYAAAFFCFALGISAKKAVLHTILSNLFLLVVVAILAALAVVAWMTVTGISWNEITGAA